MTYLTFRDPEAFVGLTKQDARPQYGYIHECPKCKAHGVWILRRDAYGPDKHFLGMCPDCEGMGYTRTPANHLHEWDDGQIIGRCVRHYVCKLCGQSRTVDSSD